MRILFALCCLISSVQAQTLLVLGDSLSAGYNMQAKQSWPALLDKQWQPQGQHRLINASVSGETTQGALARLPDLLTTHQPDWLLIELGGNDGLRGFPPSLTEKNIDNMIVLAKSQNIAVVLTQIRLPPNYGKRYIQQFEQIYPALAKQHEVALLPFFLDDIATRPELMMNDGIHPKASAQPLIRDKVQQFVEPLFKP